MGPRIYVDGDGDCDDYDDDNNSRLPTATPRVLSQVMWDVWLTKWQWGRFSSSTSVSPANSHSTNYSILINHPIIDALQSQYRQRR
jgi:hypothetical protein